MFAQFRQEQPDGTTQGQPEGTQRTVQVAIAGAVAEILVADGRRIRTCGGPAIVR